MATQIPTTQQSADQFIANFEAAFGQTIPIYLYAFLRVLAAVEARSFTQLYKLGQERALQNFALTATGQDLVDIGVEYGVAHKPGTFAQFEVTVNVSGAGVLFSSGLILVGDANGRDYRTDSEETSTSTTIVIPVTAIDAGTDGNLIVGDTMTLQAPPSGSESVGEITAVTNEAIAEETQESFRRRILQEIRTVGGGGNNVDYRRWAEQTTGVFRAFPYSGKPIGQTSLPGDRTVYIESTIDVDEDGIAPGWLLDDARDSINADPDTGIDRPPLGEVDEILFVESITRRPIHIEIRSLEIDPSVKTAAKADVETAVITHLRLITCFVSGLDVEIERNDRISDMTLSTIIADVLKAYGGVAYGVGIGIAPSTFISYYQLIQGELAELGTITYV